MGTCDLCGQEAGFLRKRHKECEEKLHAGQAAMTSLVSQSVLVPTDVRSLGLQLRQIADSSFMPGCSLKPYWVAGWERAAQHALEDDILTAEEERSLTEFAAAASLTQQDLDTHGTFMRVVKAAVIRDILEGKLPEHQKISGDIPFNLLKGERLVWAFPDARYYEERTRTHYEGGYQGFSVRVAKGLYYRAGGFRGHPVSTQEMVDIGPGMLGVTDKCIYFASAAKSFRIKYDKIVSFRPFSDGIGIQRDAQTAKPQVFVTGDGWFTYNLISNLAKGLEET